jgi:hypothetical protein
VDKDYLILKRASASRPSGQWNEEDYDVLANAEVVGRIMKVMASASMDRTRTFVQKLRHDKRIQPPILLVWRKTWRVGCPGVRDDFYS